MFNNLPNPLILGHRGYSSLAPENTMVAFDKCVELKIPGIEFDVHLTKDGKLVIIHDHDLNRVASVNALVEELTWAELKNLDVGSHKNSSFKNERIPLLEELFDRHKNNLFYDIELKEETFKETSLGEKVFAAIKKAKLEEYCMVSSFNPFALRHFNKYAKNTIPMATIFAIDEEVPKILQRGFGRHLAPTTILKPEFKQVDRKLIKKNYPIITWTVDDIQTGENLIEMGVKGLISNDPKKFLN